MHLHEELEVTLEHHGACLDELGQNSSTRPVGHQRRQVLGGVAEPHDSREGKNRVVEIHVCAVHVDLSRTHKIHSPVLGKWKSELFAKWTTLLSAGMVQNTVPTANQGFE